MTTIPVLRSCCSRFGLSLLLCLLLVVPVGHSSAAVHDSGELVPLLDETALRGMEVWDIPGVAYALVSGDKVIHRACFGSRKKGETGPSWSVDERTVFQIGSTTKAFTAALMAMLVDEGCLFWDDRVEEHLPGFRLYDPFARKDFRIVDLMAQRSGLPDHSLDGMAILGYGREAVMNALRHVRPEAPFRSTFAYQNALFLYAAAIIEKETGRSWERNLQDRIFGPLGMESAGATFDGFTADQARMAWLHRLKKEGTEVLPMDWPWQDWVYTMGPAGSIHADIEDFARWLVFLIGKGSVGERQLLAEEQVNFLMTPQTLMAFNQGDGAAYCQGWVRECYQGADLVWHNGATLGAHSIIALLPEEKAGIVVLTNQTGNELPEAMMRTFADFLSGSSDKDWVGALCRGDRGDDEAVGAEPLCPVRNATEYVGRYRNPVYGEIQVAEDEGGLRLVFLAPKPQELRLETGDGGTFTADWEIFPDPRVVVRFEPGDDGRMMSLVVEPLDDDGHGLGRFQRCREESSQGGQN